MIFIIIIITVLAVSYIFFMRKDRRYHCEELKGVVLDKYILQHFLWTALCCSVIIVLLTVLNISRIDIENTEQQTYILDSNSFEKTETISYDDNEYNISFSAEGKNYTLKSDDRNTVVVLKSNNPQQVKIEKQKYFDLVLGFYSENTVYEFQ